MSTKYCRKVKKFKSSTFLQKAMLPSALRKMEGVCVYEIPVKLLISRACPTAHPRGSLKIVSRRYGGA